MTATENAAVISANALSKHYGNSVVVDAVSFQVRRGECWGLLGPNGAGKTTLLRMLLGKTPPTSGKLTVLGNVIPRQATTMRQRLGVVPQLDALDPDFTVAENLRVFGGYFGLSREQVDQRLPRLLDFAALRSREHAAISTLSGGMQRRLSLSRALLNDPELLLLDEPTTGLDPQARQLIWQRLRSLGQQGLTIVLTTHHMEEAERLCDRVTVMDEGRLLDCDSPAALISKHMEPQVFEIYGTQANAWHLQHACTVAVRHEQAGESHFYYCHDPAPMLRALQATPNLRFLHRPSNLEDVFVKLTGRDLRDA
ncbi:MAG: lipooligosaccharide transport system ATP-binding protein [Gammaproteobacteria bacterium]|jgi:lipooligosaccharide transport system ATP-binding protein